jgi:hypothetical protein
MPSLPTRTQSAPGIASVASIRGPRSVAALTCQHTRSPSGEPLVGPSGPSIVSVYVISYSSSIIPGEAR